MNPSRQYKQLTLGQRYQIEALIGKGHAQKVAESNCRDCWYEGALSRELRVNRREDVYRADIAHTLTMQRRKTARKHKKSDERHMPIIEKGLLLGWSPEKISLRMKIEVPEIAISHTTVYKRIAANKTCGGAF